MDTKPSAPRLLPLWRYIAGIVGVLAAVAYASGLGPKDGEQQLLLLVASVIWGAFWMVPATGANAVAHQGAVGLVIGLLIGGWDTKVGPLLALIGAFFGAVLGLVVGCVRMAGTTSVRAVAETGISFFYPDSDHHLGIVAEDTWGEAQKLLPFLVSFVNRSMGEEWGGRTPPPGDHVFVLDEFIRDRASVGHEVFITNGYELLRFFAWCDFLEGMTRAFALYRPVVEVLRLGTHGIVAFLPDEDSQH